MRIVRAGNLIEKVYVTYIDMKQSGYRATKIGR
jgi:hypothetical protein